MKLITKLRKAEFTAKTRIWQDADLNVDQTRDIINEMILTLPKGHYKLHGREYGTNLIDTVYDIYGWMPAMLINESTLLGLQVLYPDKVYASFTHGLDAIEIK